MDSLSGLMWDGSLANTKSYTQNETRSSWTRSQLSIVSMRSRVVCNSVYIRFGLFASFTTKGKLRRSSAKSSRSLREEDLSLECGPICAFLCLSMELHFFGPLCHYKLVQARRSIGRKIMTLWLKALVFQHGPTLLLASQPGLIIFYAKATRTRQVMDSFQVYVDSVLLLFCPT